jgi:hypothetical protein
MTAENIPIGDGKRLRIPDDVPEYTLEDGGAWPRAWSKGWITLDLFVALEGGDVEGVARLKFTEGSFQSFVTAVNRFLRHLANAKPTTGTGLE